MVSSSSGNPSTLRGGGPTGWELLPICISFWTHLKRKSLNIYRSEKCCQENLWKGSESRSLYTGYFPPLLQVFHFSKYSTRGVLEVWREQQCESSTIYRHSWHFPPCLLFTTDTLPTTRRPPTGKGSAQWPTSLELCLHAWPSVPFCLLTVLNITIKECGFRNTGMCSEHTI
jgi:hypothetical protein